MGWAEIGNTVCPIARTLAIVGDRWTMLILRELFLATRRFDELHAQTGISPHLLSKRVRRLEADGIVNRCKYADRPRRYEYRLTAKGLDFYPVMLSLKFWGEKWGGLQGDEAVALEIIHRDCGKAVEFNLVCASCEKSYGARDTHVAIGERFTNERNARIANTLADESIVRRPRRLRTIGKKTNRASYRGRGS